MQDSGRIAQLPLLELAITAQAVVFAGLGIATR
jgi:hypothetical protein